MIFRCEGEILSDHTYRYGEQIIPPDDPTKVSDERISYTFISWSAPVPTHAGGDARELIFDAVFAEQVKNIDYDTGHNNNLLAEVILPTALLVTLTVAAATVAVILMLRRKKKK